MLRQNETTRNSCARRSSMSEKSTPGMSYTKVCALVPTRHGETYCEIFTPAVSPLSPPKESNGSRRVILMVHGLGGCTEHFSQSEIPIILADQGHTVVCFDWYSHGRSTRLSSKSVPHNIELFHSQMHDVIHCPQLPILNSKGFVAHGFSMGCYILLQYCVQYEPHICRGERQNPNEKHSGPPITQVILQSPWDGHFPVLLRGLLYVPGLLRLCKPSDMADIKSIRTLKEILLWMDKGLNYSSTLDAFAQLVTNGRSTSAYENTSENPTIASSSPASPSSAAESAGLDSSIVEVDLVAGSGVACPVLIIVGTREPPFAITARKIARHIQRAQKLAQQQHCAPATATTSTATSVPSISSDSPATALSPASAALLKQGSAPAVKLAYCKYAGHMSFAKHARGSYVKDFFQREVTEFVSSGLAGSAK